MKGSYKEHKITWVVLLLAVIALLLFAFCSPREYRDQYLNGKIFTGNVSLSAEYSQKAELVYAGLENYTGQSLYNVEFSLARLQDNTWQMRSHLTSSEGNLIRNELPSGECLSQELDAKYWVYGLEKGDYRLCCFFYLETDIQEQYCLIKEFKVG